MEHNFGELNECQCKLTGDKRKEEITSNSASNSNSFLITDHFDRQMDPQNCKKIKRKIKIICNCFSF